MSDAVKTSVFQPEMKSLLDRALSLFKSASMDETLSLLAKELLDFFGAEYVRLFAYDAVANEVYTRIKLNDVFNELKFSVSEQSVAGYTALHKKIVALDNVRDHTDLRKFPGLQYNACYEDRTGVKVRSIISAPMLENNSDLIGVIQLVNTTRTVKSYRSKLDLLVHLGKLVATAVFHHDQPQQRSTKFDFLLGEGIVSQEDINQAVRSARENMNDPIKGDPVGVLMETNGVPIKAMKASLSKYYLTDFLSFDNTRIISPDLLKGFNIEYFRRNFIIPVELKDGCLTLLLSDPFNNDLINEIKQLYGVKRCRLFVGFRKDILSYIDHAIGVAGDEVQADASSDTEPNDTYFKKTEDIVNDTAPLIVQLVNKLILDGYQSRVSDIHIEPGMSGQETTVRFRKDGTCFQFTQIPGRLSPAIINRIKIMAGLKIDEHRFPQSGKIRVKYGDSVIELRVETTPTIADREDVVMRILPGRSSFMSIDALGFSESDRDKLLGMITKPYGILLVVGPTGSGKTTTLHAILNHLNSVDKKIWTVEDPVEITQPGLRQVQVNLNIKPLPFNFARAMRSFLRADPDIIMIGEMRDKETATVAVEASLTGHLVLSTLHTNSAPETVTRLVEMGIDPLNIADSLLGVLAQRLVRVLCPDCKKEYAPDIAEVEALKTAYDLDAASQKFKENVVRLFRPVGCKECHNTGFKGRLAIHELLPATSTVKQAIRSRQTMTTIRDKALAEGMRTLKMHGIHRVIAGQTSMSEVLKVCID